jgi:hypothetical protein
MTGGGSKDPKETAWEREVATIGTRWAQIEDQLFRPVEAKMVKRATDVSSERATLRGQTSTDFSRRFGAARDAVTGSLTAAGSKPGSGRFNVALSDVAMDEGRATGLGLNDVDAAVEDQAAANRQAAIDFGMGKAAEGAAGLGRAARVSTAQSIQDARTSAASRGAVATGIGAAAAVGADSLGKSAAPAAGAKAGATPLTNDAALDSVSFEDPRVLTDEPLFGRY